MRFHLLTPIDRVFDMTDEAATLVRRIVAHRGGPRPWVRLKPSPRILSGFSKEQATPGRLSWQLSAAPGGHFAAEAWAGSGASTGGSTSVSGCGGSDSAFLGGADPAAARGAANKRGGR
jgi:hypothetical protein